MTEIIGIIQARMGSSRVPGKALLDLAGKPLIWHVIDRMRRLCGIKELVLATTTDPRNKPLIKFAEEVGVRAFQHKEENDLAGRIAGAIRNVPGDMILKVGGDCPLVDPPLMQRMINVAHSEKNADFI